MALSILLVGAFAGLLAFANGANDNAKGVATLVGAGTLSMKQGVLFAAVTTMLGSVAAVVLARELVDRFTGKGVVDEALVGQPAFAASVAAAAGLTVLAATCISMPISTTHAIVGAIVGIGLAADSLRGSAVIKLFMLPLLISPLLAITLTAVAYVVLTQARRVLGLTHQTCFCIGREVHPVHLTTDGAIRISATGVRLTADEQGACRDRYVGRFIGLDAQRLLNASHVLSAGALSFARGLNDTPKIAAVLLAAGALDTGFDLRESTALTVTGLAIAAGGLLAARRVGRTMSYRITGMNDGQALTANLVAAVLVIFASKLGLPVSTTHMTCGGLFGIGLVNRRAHWSMVGMVVLAWVTTLPAAAILGWLSWRLIAG